MFKISDDQPIAIFIGGPVDGDSLALTPIDVNKQALYIIEKDESEEYIRTYQLTYRRLDPDADTESRFILFIYSGEKKEINLWKKVSSPQWQPTD